LLIFYVFLLQATCSYIYEAIGGYILDTGWFISCKSN